MKIQVKKDDDRLGIKAGETYIAQSYGPDGEKITLLSRVPDGYNPYCNQYRGEVDILHEAK